MVTEIRSIQELRSHADVVGNSFFSAGNVRYFGRDRHHGIYRGPYMPLDEGYLITETRREPTEPTGYVVYRFEATDSSLNVSYIHKHESLADAEAFLAAMGSTK